MISKPSLKTLIVLVAFTCTATTLTAQPADPGLDPDPGPNTSVPFDGGLTLLIAAGAGFAIKKSRDNRRKEEKK
jgi:hypothetical protein